MWGCLLQFASCFSCVRGPKVSPEEEKAVEKDAEPQEESIDRGTNVVLDMFTVAPQPPMSQPRPSKSSADVLAELRQQGVLPLHCGGSGTVAFMVPAGNPPSEPDAPPQRRPMKLEKLEERMQERRRKFKKKPAESGKELKEQLSNAGIRRQERLAERSRKLASRTAKIASKRAARDKPKGTAFLVSSVSDTDAITPCDSAKARALERRMAERRQRVAKKTTADDLEKSQKLAAERRREKRAATVFKARQLGRNTCPPGWEEPDLDTEPIETYEPSTDDSCDDSDIFEQEIVRF